MVTAGPDPTPIPVSDVDSGLSGASSARVTVAFSVPLIVGEKVTVSAQVDCGTIAAVVQVLVSLKSLWFVPEIATEEMFRFVLPVFVTVIVWGALVVPSFWFPKFSAGDNPTFGLGANFATNPSFWPASLVW